MFYLKIMPQRLYVKISTITNINTTNANNDNNHATATPITTITTRNPTHVNIITDNTSDLTTPTIINTVTQTNTKAQL
jgi:hypothetical protein